MSVPLKDQLSCARAVLAQMRERNSRWTGAQEAIVATLERQVRLEEISNEIKSQLCAALGQKTREVEV